MNIVTAGNPAEAAGMLDGAPSPIVVIPVHNSYEDVIRCLDSVDTQTDERTSILIVDDAGVDRRLFARLQTLSDRRGRTVVVLHHSRNMGLVRSCNTALAVTAGRDVVFLNSDVVVGAEWLERLTAAAMSSDTVATATSLTNHGTIVSVPIRNTPVASLPGGLTPQEAARRVARASKQLRPSIPTAVGHCFYLRREVVDIIGGFDEDFDPGYGEEVDLCQRAVTHGFRHVVADDVFTYHRGSASFGHDPRVGRIRDQHEALLRVRYPWYGTWVERTESDRSSGLADALDTARRSLLGLSVGIDGLCLGEDQMGTQLNVLETIRALAQRPEIARLVVFVPTNAPMYVRELARDLSHAEFVEVDLETGNLSTASSVDVLYRPYQVTDLTALRFVDRVGTRFAVNQLDTIAFENPAYFPDAASWLRYRDATRLALQLADGIVFASDASRRAAESQGLVAAGTPCAVVHCGGGNENRPGTGSSTRPGALRADADRFVLCIGTSYLHKNRRFTLELWHELRQRGWPGMLVFAGPTPPHGNSLAQEADFLLGAPELRDQVVTIGTVTDSERHWLYEHAALVLYPSTVEGFGMVPFEAARHGVPTLTTRRTSLDEILPESLPVLENFDVIDGANLAWKLLNDPSAASEVTSALQACGDEFRWETSAASLMTLFEEMLRQPLNRVLSIDGEAGWPVHATSDVDHGAGRQMMERTLERAVAVATGHPLVKGVLSPEGSKRQQIARVVINRARVRVRFGGAP